LIKSKPRAVEALKELELAEGASEVSSARDGAGRFGADGPQDDAAT
jgi:hypothetical protein